MNTLRTGILMAFLTGLFVTIGYAIGGESGMVMAFLFAAGTNLFAYWNSDKVVLAMYRAQEVARAKIHEAGTARPVSLFHDPSHFASSNCSKRFASSGVSTPMVASSDTSMAIG